MARISKFFIHLSIIAAFSCFSVLCCCTAAGVMAHLHKKVMCSHCQEQNANGHAADPAGKCQHQWINAELSQSPIILSAFSSGASSLVDKHPTVLSFSLRIVYPPGGPPLGISLTPLYLRTFHLRV